MQIVFLKGVVIMFNFLEAAADQGGNLWMSVGLIVVMFAFFYFFMLRPQKKQEKETKAMRDGLTIGDEITTIGGIIGKIVAIKDETVWGAAYSTAKVSGSSRDASRLSTALITCFLMAVIFSSVKLPART